MLENPHFKLPGGDNAVFLSRFQVRDKNVLQWWSGCVPARCVLSPLVLAEDHLVTLTLCIYLPVLLFCFDNTFGSADLFWQDEDVLWKVMF